MGFMYLELSSDDRGVHAEVKNEGDARFRSLGTGTSRQTAMPFAVFQIAGFTGLASISDDDLEDELARRLGPERLTRRLAARLSTAELLTMLGEHVKWAGLRSGQ